MKPSIFQTIAIGATILLVALVIAMIVSVGKVYGQNLQGMPSMQAFQPIQGVNESVSTSRSMFPGLSVGMQTASAGTIFSSSSTIPGIASAEPSSSGRFSGSFSISADWPDLISLTYTYALPVKQTQVFTVSDTVSDDMALLGMPAKAGNILTAESVVKDQSFEFALTRFTSASSLGPSPLRPFSPQLTLTPILSLERFALQVDSTGMDADGKRIETTGSTSYTGWLYGFGVAPQVRFMQSTIQGKGLYQIGRSFRGSVFDIQILTDVWTYGSVGVGYQWRQGKLTVEEFGADVIVDDRGAYVTAAMTF